MILHQAGTFRISSSLTHHYEPDRNIKGNIFFRLPPWSPDTPTQAEAAGRGSCRAHSTHAILEILPVFYSSMQGRL